MVVKMPPIIVENATRESVDSHTLQGGLLDQVAWGCREVDKVVEHFDPGTSPKERRDLVCHVESNVPSKLDRAELATELEP